MGNEVGLRHCRGSSVHGTALCGSLPAGPRPLAPGRWPQAPAWPQLPQVPVRPHAISPMVMPRQCLKLLSSPPFACPPAGRWSCPSCCGASARCSAGSCPYTTRRCGAVSPCCRCVGDMDCVSVVRGGQGVQFVVVCTRTRLRGSTSHLHQASGMAWRPPVGVCAAVMTCCVSVCLWVCASARRGIAVLQVRCGCGTGMWVCAAGHVGEARMSLRACVAYGAAGALQVLYCLELCAEC